MRIGILITTAQHQNLNEATRFARRKFQVTAHCDGHEPAEIHLHPDRGIKAGTFIDGLPVVHDEQVAINALRLTTVNLPDDESDDELNRERAIAARQIAAMKQRVEMAQA